MANQTINWKQIATLLSPAGQQQLVDFVRRAKEDRGKHWLPEIKREYPTFSWIVDLVANKTADEAFAELQAEFPVFPLHLVEGKIHNLHAALSAEIDKPR